MKMKPKSRKERIDYILEKLDRNGHIYVSNLAADLSVSEVTIRSDICMLEKIGVLRRVHGGAQQTSDLFFKKDIRRSLNENIECKLAISRTAFKYIFEGATIIIDDSSTCFYLAKEIRDKQLRVTIITNSIYIANELLKSTHSTVCLLGGVMSKYLGSTSGRVTVQELENIHADYCFISSNGVSWSTGVTVIDYQQMLVKKSMMKASAKKFLLVESKKFGVDYPFVVDSLSAFDQIVTDSLDDANVVATIEAGACVQLASH